MSYLYETSKTFDRLKGVKEKITHNYSTEQYLNTLDTMLFNAVRPVFMSSDFSNMAVASYLAWFSDATSSRVSFHDRLETLQCMMAILTVDDPEDKWALYVAMRPIRTVTFSILDVWLTRLKNYRRYSERLAVNPSSHRLLLHVQTLEASIGHDPTVHSNLYAAIAQAKFWSDQAVSFKNSILEKYMRSIVMKSQSFYKAMNHSISLDDLIQASIVGASRAIDRCDQRRGTLTTYIDQWLRGVRATGAQFEKDTAYSVPMHVKARKDFSYKSSALDSEDVLNVEDDRSNMEVRDQESYIRQIARLVDPMGIGRHALGIEEHVPSLQRLLNTNRKS